MEVKLDQDAVKEDIAKEPEPVEDGEDDDEEGMGVKAKALTKLLKTSSV